MATSSCFTTICSLNKPGLVGNPVAQGKVLQVNRVLQTSKTSKSRSFVIKATDDKKTAKPRSIVCTGCEGNGAVSCSQCKGSGVNSVDHFNGRFKAGGLCWLCRGKRETLCGNCNGAGFVGGFMSSFDE